MEPIRDMVNAQKSRVMLPMGASHVRLSTCRPASRSQGQRLGIDHGIPPLVTPSNHSPSAFQPPRRPSSHPRPHVPQSPITGSPSSSIAGPNPPVRCSLGSLMTSEPHPSLALYHPAESECRCGPPLLASLTLFTRYLSCLELYMSAYYPLGNGLFYFSVSFLSHLLRSRITFIRVMLCY
jgi:hypothetical protein